jgi:5'-nucleotidase
VRILVTNDDGVDSIGIQVLAAALAEAGHEVLVVAPSSDRSGTAASLGLFSPAEGMAATFVELPEAPGVEAWALDAPPAMCTLAVLLGGFGDVPDLVVSGINAGLNTGRAILHSGTVGAVLTAQNFGLSGLAVSVQARQPVDQLEREQHARGTEPGDERPAWYWDTAAALAVEVLPLVADAPPRSVLNLNVPDRRLEDVEGLRWASLAAFGEVRAGVVGSDEGNGTRRLRMELLLSDQGIEPDTDQGVVAEGWASLTSLVGVVEAWPGEEGLDPDDVLADVARTMVPGAPLERAHRLPDVTGGVRLRRFQADA